MRAPGLTLIELVCVIVIMLLIAGVALPLSVNAVRRQRELELQRALSEMRHAINEYHKYAMYGQIQPWDPDWEQYPKDLDMLVDGVEVTAPNSPTPKTVTLLRRIPIDPMTGTAAWGTRSYQDDPDDSSTGGENVFDVYSLSGGMGLNGIPYSEWYSAQDCSLN